MKLAKRLVLLFLVLIFAVSVDAAPAADSLKVILPDHTTSFSLKTLLAKLPRKTITIEDPVYGGKTKSYDGFALTDVLALAGWNAGSSGDEIVFTAKDGYAPNTALSQLRSHAALLAFEEHGKKRDFEKVTQGKAKLWPGPYYLVWEEGKALAESVPWPYQLVQIEVVDFKKKYDRIYPSGASPDSSVMKGFLVFKNRCIRCHSINLQGGDVGPELNAPKNVTEYWKRDNLRAFIRDASSFRYKSKMPPFTDLKEGEIEQVLDYIASMADRKWKP